MPSVLRVPIPYLMQSPTYRQAVPYLQGRLDQQSIKRIDQQSTWGIYGESPNFFVHHLALDFALPTLVLLSV